MENQKPVDADNLLPSEQPIQPEIAETGTLCKTQQQNLNAQTAKSKLSVSDWLNIFQMLALVCAGVWTVFIFTRFEERDKQVASQISELSLQKSKLEIEQMNAIPLSSIQKINIEEITQTNPKSQKRFRVIYTPYFTNKSSRQIEITTASIRVFFRKKEEYNRRVIEIPSLIELDNLKKWEEVLSKAYIIEEKWTPDAKVLTRDGKEISAFKGGLSSVLERGETSHGSLSLIVQGREEDFIGFRLEIGINDNGSAAERVFESTQETLLAPGEYSDSPEINENDSNK
ncbi:hypothetical protein H6G74_20025 [Nostoc spongiaeforme FACHB-130]|uniref:Uncharacterized protein n=1 Tax=Nostoc spongiaeforme FACHB-130 TaxID=1357510 RepID=A0ABR8G070_9NOSO|nr:hypothetical protein [Nostoc spongiaeforme]MBD2596602.1 hypothetical protein [Nostoc spongiaeforme FACHB-130]